MAKTPAKVIYEALLSGTHSVDSREAIESVATAYPEQWEHNPIGALQRYSADEGLREGNLPEYVKAILETPISRYGHICHWIQCEEPRLEGLHCCALHELSIRANSGG